MKKIFGLAFLMVAFLAPGVSQAATCFWVGGTGSWSTSNTASWASASGGTTGTCAATGGIPKQAADTATFDAASGGGTVTVDSTMNGVTLTQITMGAFTGTLDFSANNPSITLNIFSISGTGTRTLNLGSGTFTLPSASSSWDAATATNLTLNAGTSTISFTATSNVANRIFGGGAKTYNTVTFSTASTTLGSGGITFTGANTFATLTISGPTVATFTAATVTITNAFTWTGSPTAPLVVIGNPNGTGTISSANNGTISYAIIAGETFAGGGTFTCNNCYGYTASGITINAPSGGGGGGIIGG